MRRMFGCVVLFALGLTMIAPALAQSSPPTLLTDPFLQAPTRRSVQVVWFTEFAGSEHYVTYGDNRRAAAETTRMSRMREDQRSRVPDRSYDAVTERPIWRHEAHVDRLQPGERLPYSVTSVREDGQRVTSDTFTLGPTLQPGTPATILLTSDHQLMPMTPANLQKVAETVGRVDAVLLAGDLVNIPDRASEWFDKADGGAFFPALQGRASRALTKNGITTVYRGGELIQHAPVYPAAGNHEVMGRFSTSIDLDTQYNDPQPRDVAEQRARNEFGPGRPRDPARQQWIANNSHNTISYQELFTLPQSREGGELYYATTIGDVRLISLFTTRIARGGDTYLEKAENLSDPTKWGYGQLIFEPIKRGSPQWRFLQRELHSREFRNAKYTVMIHDPMHGLGGRVVPAFTDPVQIIERNDAGEIVAIRYEYPKDKNYLIRDVEPLLERAGVDLLLNGHTHIWNRFVGATGINMLESANVGNSYGAYLDTPRRLLPPPELADKFVEQYDPTGDPYGLEPIVPTIAPLLGADGTPLPYIASNDITAFSILETGTGTISSYYFDTRDPNNPVVKFDEFRLE
jgi:hypothetical protein